MPYARCKGVQLGDNMQEFLPEVRRIADEAADAILEVYQSADFRVAIKEDFSPLTQADLASHRHIVAGLEGLVPALPVLSEESQGITYEMRRHWDTFWLVDPLDGTKEFLRRNGAVYYQHCLDQRSPAGSGGGAPAGVGPDVLGG